MRKASILVRLLAFFLDCILLSCLGIVILVAAFAGHIASGAPLGLSQIFTLMLIVFFSSTALFLFYFTYLTMGQEGTLGKRLFGLRVVRQDGSPLCFRQALARCLTYIVSLTFWPISLLTALFCDGRMVHDIMAGTKVIKEES